MEPGTHRLSVGLDAEFEVMEAEVTVEAWAGATAAATPWCPRAGAGPASVSTSRLPWPAGPVRQQLGIAEPGRGRDATGPGPPLTRLPRSTVLQPPTPTEAFGRDTIHLKLRINDNCPVPENYQVAEDRGITYSNLAQDIVIDFWVLDLGGAPVVVDMWHQSGSSVQLMDRVAQARDSISFVPAE